MSQTEIAAFALAHGLGLPEEMDALRTRIVGLEAEVERLRTVLEEIGKEADHGIPFYAYGDNQAGCEFSTRLSWISGRVGNALRGENLNKVTP